MKKAYSCFLAVILLLAGGTGYLFSGPEKQEWSVFYEGKKVSGTAWYLEDGFGYVPVKDIAKIYRMAMSWKSVSREVVLTIHAMSVGLKIGSDIVVIGNVPRLMNNKTKEINGHICAPLTLLLTQSFVEATRCSTAWNKDTKTLEVDKKVNVQPPHFYSDESGTSVVFEYAHYVIARDELKNGQVTLTFDNGIAGSDEQYSVQDGVIKEIRMSQHRKKVRAEVILASADATPVVHYKTEPNRVVLEVKGTVNTAVPEVAAVTEVKKYIGSQKVIVIDPGHGGKDPGAIGRNGTKEKEINLKISLKLAALLKREGNFTVILTRDSDRFIPLLERTNIANKHRADIFVSVHCNSSLKPTSEGFEIYFLSGEATDKAAEATAVLENSALQLEAESRVKKKKIDQLLWSIAHNLFHKESAEICSCVLHQLQKRDTINSRSAKQARFYVLVNAKMPSVLIENGFLSNKKEEAQLKSKRFQAKLVDAYYAGIVDYFTKRP